MYKNIEMISSLISSRICHDLVSPVGAIRNGIELLEMSGVKPSVEMDLINQSAENANARLSFLRVAFGHADERSALSERDIHALLDSYFNEKRVSVNWLASGTQPRKQVKLILLLIMCFEAGLPHGGEILVRHSDENWEIAATGKHTSFNAAIWDALISDREYALSSATIQFELVRGQMKLYDITPKWAMKPDSLTVRYRAA